MPIDHFPPQISGTAERLRAFLLTDATVMLILGAALVAHGIGLLPPPGQDVHPWEEAVPFEAWMAVWILLGVASIVASLRHTSKAASLILSADVTLLTLWGATFILVDSDELFSRGGTYLALALITMWAVWRGKRGELHIRHE